jgi:signal peptidase I
MVDHGDLALNSGASPWLTVWRHPQATIRRIQRNPHMGRALFVAALAGIAGALSLVLEPAGRGGPELARLLPALAIGGLVLNIVSIYIGSAATAVLGWLLGGKAAIRDMRLAFAWSQVPLAFALVPVLIVQSIALLGVFGLSGLAATEGYKSALIAVSVILGILDVWTFFLMVRTIGAVQGFGVFRSMLNLFGLALFAVILALPIRFFAYQPFTIPSASMAPTLIPGDYVFASKFAYGYSRFSLPIPLGITGRVWGAEPKRGDLAIFRLPSDTSFDYVARVVGLPGDRVQMIGGVLQINGKPVELRRTEDFVGAASICNRGRKGEAQMARYVETLPGGRQYEILDCRAGSEGDETAVFEVPAGHYFMLGDNRDNSNDSRFGVGFVPYENLVARVSVIVFSMSGENGTLRKERRFRFPQ